MVVDFFGDAAVIVISTPLLYAEFICVHVLTVCINDIEGHGVLREADCEESAWGCHQQQQQLTEQKRSSLAHGCSQTTLPVSH